MKKASQSDYKSVCSPLAERLTELMKVNDKKQADIAELLDVTRQSVSQYCGGASLPPVDKLVILADYFEVSTDYLLGRTDVKTTDTTIKGICEYTGLSEKVIEWFNIFHFRKSPILEIFNFIMEEEISLSEKQLDSIIGKITDFIYVVIPDGIIYEFKGDYIVKKETDENEEDGYCPDPISPFSARAVAHSVMLSGIENELRRLKDKYNNEVKNNGKHTGETE